MTYTFARNLERPMDLPRARPTKKQGAINDHSQWSHHISGSNATENSNEGSTAIKQVIFTCTHIAPQNGIAKLHKFVEMTD